MTKRNYLVVVVLVIVVAVYAFFLFPSAPAVKLKGDIYVCVCVRVLCRIFFGRRSYSFVQSFPDISIACSYSVG